MSSELKSVDMMNQNHSLKSKYISGDIQCSYIDENDLLKITSKHEVLFISINIQSFNAKLDRLTAFLSNLRKTNVSPHVIALQEIFGGWGSSPPHIDGYHPLIFNTRLEAKGGGVGILVREDLNFTINDQLSVFNERCFESICIDLLIGNSRFCLVSLYKPPHHPD